MWGPGGGAPGGGQGGERNSATCSRVASTLRVHLGVDLWLAGGRGLEAMS
mgnify:CR=1 FL=1